MTRTQRHNDRSDCCTCCAWATTTGYACCTTHNLPDPGATNTCDEAQEAPTGIPAPGESGNPHEKPCISNAHYYLAHDGTACGWCGSAV